MLLREGYKPEAVSRGYYAMFYVARALLVVRGITVHKHSAVLAAFGRELVRTGVVPAHLHRALLDAFRDRQTVDYLIDDEPTTSAVESLLVHAAELVALGERDLSGFRLSS